MTFEEMIEADWRHEDRLAETPQSYAAATERQIDRSLPAPTDLRTGGPETFLAREAAELDKLSAKTRLIQPSLETCKRRES